MSKLHRNVLDTIGGTPQVMLRNIVPRNGARLLLKLESANPTGSMKDRMALAMIEAAEADGRFLVPIKPSEADTQAIIKKVFPTRIQVVQNWFAELEQKVPSNQ